MNTTQLRNFKKRAKAYAKRAEKREELLTSEPIIKTVLHLLDDPNADIFLIKRVVDKVSFHSLYEDLSHVDHSDELELLQQVFSKEWNKGEYIILNVLLPLACVIAAEIRESE